MGKRKLRITETHEPFYLYTGFMYCASLDNHCQKYQKVKQEVIHEHVCNMCLNWLAIILCC